ncbi:MAG: formylglycine-generating enzyme family protein [Spirochaetaceae bacterium]|jgi:formylglycine-generating enzyme required for sulfatase activity|nr:formylglycine-generating enzyme family protein [Spirochaetaceae bacterium]
MKSNLQIILNRIVKERGIGILDKTGLCKALLQDYAKGTFKREIHLFVLSLEAGCHRELLRSEEAEPIKQRLIWKLQDDYGIIPAYAEETIALLGALIEERELSDEEKLRKLEKNAGKGDCRAQYELGVLCKKLQKYEAALYWFEIAAKQGVELYETLQKSPPAPEIPENFARIPAGTFIMGSPDSEWGRKADEIQHEVRISSFYMGKHAVTQASYQAITGLNPSRFKNPDLPVESVSWFDAIAFCNALSGQEGRSPAYSLEAEQIRWNPCADGYRLPTEAEWEYACRAGTATPFSGGANIATNQSNYNGRYPYNTMTKGIFRETTLPSGSFPPNPWGLYDMHGNVWEWCWDWYDAYRPEAGTNPVGPAFGTDRVFRGGSWCSLGQKLRSANRGLNIPSYRSSDLGFRLLLPEHG